ncbi:MAG TPA: hypothetical protein VF438_00040, partial [Candidatus Paceibacterota bacterium]
MEYLHWAEQIIPANASAEQIADMYAKGFVFTRIGKGVMQQTRSSRVDLSKFEMSSENRRIMKKTTDLTMNGRELLNPATAQAGTTPTDYDFTIGKMAKDFYDTKFSPGIMSAQKIKEMLTDKTKSNFNCLLSYSIPTAEKPIGHVICYTSDLIHHYSYPFYDLTLAPKDMGMGMMLRALELCKKLGHKYMYL